MDKSTILILIAFVVLIPLFFYTYVILPIESSNVGDIPVEIEPIKDEVVVECERCSSVEPQEECARCASGNPQEECEECPSGEEREECERCNQSN